MESRAVLGAAALIPNLEYGFSARATQSPLDTGGSNRKTSAIDDMHTYAKISLMRPVFEKASVCDCIKLSQATSDAPSVFSSESVKCLLLASLSLTSSAIPPQYCCTLIMHLD